MKMITNMSEIPYGHVLKGYVPTYVGGDKLAS